MIENLKKGKVAFFLPARSGSERVHDKNTRPFAGIPGGLMQNKMLQLVNTALIDEIILSTNDEKCIAIASEFTYDSRVKILRRPDSLCLSSTNLQDLIAYVPSVTDADYIVWGHVTTPLAGPAEYDLGVEMFFRKMQEGFDSLVGVKELKNYLLDKTGRVVNNTTSLPWPRTQDLEPLYLINHTMFIASRQTYVTDRNRVGRKPYLHVMDEIHSFDIDWEDDFVIAEALYSRK